MSETTAYCSFCAKSQHDAFVIFSGPAVFICDECIDLGAIQLAEKRAARELERDNLGKILGAVHL